ncbi:MULTISPECIES: SLATT domain-containing protein [unclassified Streptomyces]|uniref:SLATT domain-containing protein n=1 Tax=unclassified Streptomyces TaxID=2593676 RepID=UPI0022B63A90|nr:MULTISPECIES: SLATT domain-containing protein [unclassified Streptomyces]MCZ7415337.1 SLATT domain-containing protein [Streptomyces sp. WMMC897]MCZ7432260.1 SLATT domain-containing protein [Streptomyces sp. WMMC1477]
MSQPEMQPGGGRREGRGELLGRTFPLGDWGEPAERLDELYQWVEEGALAVVDWYLADRAWKRRGARALRTGAALGAAAGGVLPVLELSGVFAGVGAWGFLALLGAALCLGADRWFGCTAGWMRDLCAAQAVQRRLETLQYDWAAEAVREVLGPTEGSAGEAAERCLTMLRRFTEDVTELVRVETVDWMVTFRPGPVSQFTQSPAPAGWTAPRSEPSGPGGLPRFPVPPPGARPNMPRQRPPENPR